MSDWEKNFVLPEDLLTSVNLPYLLLATGVNCVTEQTIPVIVHRIKWMDPELVDRISARYDLFAVLQRFIGVTTNTDFWTDKEFYAAKRKVEPATAASTVAKIEKLRKAIPARPW